MVATVGVAVVTCKSTHSIWTIAISFMPMAEMGSRELTQHAREALGVDLHGTADDVTLEPVYCLGTCACAPAVMLDNRTHGRVDAARFDELLATLRQAAQ